MHLICKDNWHIKFQILCPVSVAQIVEMNESNFDALFNIPQYANILW
jgi:hypothetical protein